MNIQPREMLRHPHLSSSQQYVGTLNFSHLSLLVFFHFLQCLIYH